MNRRTLFALCLPLLALALVAPSALFCADPPRKADYAIVLHGGALDDVDKMPADLRAAYEKSLREALTLGKGVLEKGGTSLDAVEQVIRLMEDDPIFNAGKGAVFNSAGGHELDASIMDGRTKACGAVAGVKTVKNPISLARLVMTKTRHVLLTADGADRFAEEMGVEQVDQKYFWTERQFQNWKKAQAKQQAADAEKKKGTVGCVALDRQGNLAAGTSTGGLTNKKYGRVGDSPIIGAGTYADNESCGVSCSGTGEEFIRNAISFDVSARVKYQKLTLAESVRQVIHEVLKPDVGGLIALGRDGTIVADFNTDGLSRAAADSAGRFEVRMGR